MKNKHLISFLIPSRKRYKKLEETISTLLESCESTDNFEVLIALDEDDTETIKKTNNLIKNINVNSKIIISKRHSYEKLHYYYNELCKYSKSKWLWLWNDDSKILTDKWDKIIKEKTKKNENLICLVPDGRSKGCIFPILHRQIYKDLGYFSLSAHNDTFIEYAILRYFEENQNWISINEINITHTSASEGKENKNKEIKQTYKDTEKAKQKTVAEFYSKETQKNILNTMLKIIEKKSFYFPYKKTYRLYE